MFQPKPQPISAADQLDAEVNAMIVEQDNAEDDAFVGDIENRQYAAQYAYACGYQD